MGDTVLFSPNTKDAAGNAVNPSFVGGGSIIKQPDIFPIFPGVGWPGTGDISVAKIMSAVNSLVAGPYLDGLKQYGYIGPAQVRDPRIDTQPYQAGLSPLVPGVNQAANYSGAINGYITGLLQNDEIPNVDDNHDLIVMVFLDQNNQFPEKMDAKGNITPSFSGANEAIEYFELLDDNTRFEGAWIITSGRSLAQVMQTFAHELVEAITDPFNSGWRQTNPPPTSGQDQLADVCNQAGTVGGVPVVAYWSDADLACIISRTGLNAFHMAH